MPIDFETLYKLIDGRAGIADVACPECGPLCKTKLNAGRKVLRVWFFGDGEVVKFFCARCGAHGYAKREGGSLSRIQFDRPKPQVKPDRGKLAHDLWEQSIMLPGTPAAVYLKTRHCYIESVHLRYLPARKKYHHCLIARFASKDGSTSAVHLTRLSKDGTHKADDIENPKIMLGKSMGWPIIVSSGSLYRSNQLYVTEGIEDAASLAIITGCASWAAGSAMRIPAVVKRTKKLFTKVMVAMDDDPAGWNAIQASLKIRPDIVPVNFTLALQSDTKQDANSVLIERGAAMVRACLEWSEKAAA